MFDFDEEITRAFCDRVSIKYNPAKEDKAAALCELAYFAENGMHMHVVEGAQGWVDEGYLTQAEANRIIEVCAEYA